MYDFASNFAIGVDIESVERFKKADIMKNAAFLNKVFTRSELDYCLASKWPEQHLGARFAGKEAVIKALAFLKRAGLGYKDIEITNDEDGLPTTKIRKAGFDDLEIKLSLSHSRQEAIAFALVVPIKPSARSSI